MRKRALLIFSFLIAVACSDRDDTNEANPQQATFLFEDGFETQNNDLDELFPSDASRWTLIQLVNPIGLTNEMSVVASPVSEGTNALRILSNQSNALLSKIDIEKSGFQAFSGSTVTIKANFYIATDEPLTDLFLIDLECCSCWDPVVDLDPSSDGDNQCPGIRLKITGDGFLSIERGKISAETLNQTSLAFPRNEWVTVEWKMTLSDDQDGTNSLRINGNELINNAGVNLPNAATFAQVFAENGINFTLQEPVFYERIQVGATANPSAGTIELYVDDFSLQIE